MTHTLSEGPGDRLRGPEDLPGICGPAGECVASIRFYSTSKGALLVNLHFARPVKAPNRIVKDIS